MAQYAHLSSPDPEWLKVASVLPTPSIPTDFVRFRNDTAVFRKTLDTKRDPPIRSGLTVSEKELPVADGMIPIRLYIPQPDQELGEEDAHRFPVLVWIFGGGFCVGSIDDDDTLLRSLTVKLRISCVTVEYRKTPEFPFPTGLNDCYAALKWAAANIVEVRADLNKGFILGGQSSGGNFAAAMAQRALKDPELKGKLTGQAYLIPTLVHSRAHPDKYKAELLSLEQNKDAPFLNKEWIFYSYDMCGAPYPSDPEMSPLLSPSFKDLPPTYIQISGLDPVRDEGFLYERLLRESGVPTKVDVYPGFPHGFHIYFPELEASHRQRRQFLEGLSWLLQTR